MVRQEVLVTNANSQVGEKTAECPVVLTPAQIFASSDSMSLSVFGSILYGSLIRKTSIKDPKMSPKRISEVYEEINRRCQEIGIKPEQLDLVGQQMYALFKEREELSINKFPLDDSGKK